MGCCVNKGADHGMSFDRGSYLAEELCREEKIIIENEKQLQFTQIQSKEIIRSIKSEGLDNTLSLAQLKRAFIDINIPESAFTTPDAPLRNLLAKVTNDKKLYEQRKLVLVGILLGKGTPQEKCEWLFRQYDDDASSMMDQNEVNLMLNDLIDVAVNVLPNVSKGDGIGFLTKDELDAYRDTLLSGKEKFIEEMIKLIMTEREIMHVELAAKMADTSNILNKLLWSFGIRTLLKKHSTH
ncbi:unnamed protein product [Blepharisma stoltei]|uniref:EF-hand domain-containing protein n=1 Tax=Blepharisma stoltei TaxID=1481888 RepID=A0AAU9JAT3_9CILI|nr:unnamed protein product [Blepharisma stoltei]